MGDAFVSAISTTLQNVFEEIQVLATMPDGDASGFDGTIIVRLDAFEPRIRFIPGFWSGSATATTDLSLGVTVHGPGGSLLGTSVGGSRTAEGGAGAVCGGGAQVLAESIEKSMRDALERMAERVSSSSRIREAVERNQGRGESAVAAE